MIARAFFGLYDSIYRQGSSVAHYDLYSINMLGLYDNGSGLVLAPDPSLPIVTVVHCALFDIVQCAEALARADVPAPTELANELIGQWWGCVQRTGLLDGPMQPNPEA